MTFGHEIGSYEMGVLHSLASHRTNIESEKEIAACSALLRAGLIDNGGRVTRRGRNALKSYG